MPKSLEVENYQLLRLKTNLCCYIRLLEEIESQLQFQKNSGEAGMAVSILVSNLFNRLLNDPQIGLYKNDIDFEKVTTLNDPITEYAVIRNYLRTTGSRTFSFRANIVAVAGMTKHAITELINPATVLISEGVGQTTYSEAVCQLQHHFKLIKAYYCDQLENNLVQKRVI